MLNNGVIEKFINGQYRNLAEKHREQMNERQNIVYTLIPEIEDIDRDIATVGVRYSSKVLSGAVTATEIAEGMEKELNALKEKKKQLLKAHNLSEDVFNVAYECNVCKDTGYVNGEKCVCYKHRMKKFMSDAASKISNVPFDFDNNNFKNADFSFYSKDVDKSIGVSPYDNAKNIYRTCLAFCNNFAEKYDNLYIYGPAGVGKTYLTSCIVAELVNKGYGVIYQTSYKLFKFLEDCHFGRSTVENENLLKSAIYDCELLIIDDFGTEFINSYTQSALFDLLNTRILEKRPTIINSNLNMNDVKNTYTDRISSRIMGEFTLLKFVGEDIRLQKKERNM